MEHDLRVLEGTRRGEACNFEFEGGPVTAYSGETLAAALLAVGRRSFRHDTQNRPRGPYCNMGTCFECIVEVLEGSAWRTVRACLFPVAEGLKVRPVRTGLPDARPS